MCSLFYYIAISLAFGQSNKYYNPLEQKAIQGRLQELNTMEDFGRLPQEVKSLVRQPVWNLGTNSAGLYVEFHTNADSIQVRYKVKNALNMPHMPTTGVSGVDLYALDNATKNWEWAFGQYQFKDTITFNFNNIGSNAQRTYRLYLPLYNTLDWLEIGVDSGRDFKFIHQQSKPIIIYGTSIAQGACASRPGLAWTNRLGRSFENEVINLAFSGNGRLEQPILNLINKEDAAAYILDCIPNLTLTKNLSEAQLDSLITNAVTYLRGNHKNTPILLAEHSSAYTVGFQNKNKMTDYIRSSEVVRASFEKLKKLGDKNLYFISAADIGMDINSTVDYTHPNDIGMLKIAEAYQKVLKNLLH